MEERIIKDINNLFTQLFQKMHEAGYMWDSESKQLLSLKAEPIDEQKTIEWSEEDENIYQSIMDDTVQENQLDEKQTDWLRNIKYRNFARPQNRWKPSDEQIGLLQAIVNDPNNASSESCQIVLKEVIRQLKKLK